MILIECANRSDNHDDDHSAIDTSPQQFLAILPCRNLTRLLTFCAANDQLAYNTPPPPPGKKKKKSFNIRIFLFILLVVNLLRHFPVCPDPTYPSKHQHL